MKLSIVIPVLNSHEVVRRQCLHFAKMPLPDDVEVVLVDDGALCGSGMGSSGVDCDRPEDGRPPKATDSDAMRRVDSIAAKPGYLRSGSLSMQRRHMRSSSGGSPEMTVLGGRGSDSSMSRRRLVGVPPRNGAWNVSIS